MPSLRCLYWLRAAAWVAVIYGSLPWVRPLCEFLKKETPFNGLVNWLFAGILLFILYFCRLKPFKIIPSYFWGLSLLGIYSTFFMILKIPEEKIHLIQYGFLAFLIWRALHHNGAGHALRPYILAFLLTSFLGWVDEIIQPFLPDRYYQTSDVLLNAVSGVLGLLGVAFLRTYGVFSGRNTNNQDTITK